MGQCFNSTMNTYEILPNPLHQTPSPPLTTQVVLSFAYLPYPRGGNALQKQIPHKLCPCKKTFCF